MSTHEPVNCGPRVAVGEWMSGCILQNNRGYDSFKMGWKILSVLYIYFFFFISPLSRNKLPYDSRLSEMQKTKEGKL